MSQTRRLPIFPLPDVVFLPETHLPLHVFEPRYRAMLADALEGDRTIGVQLLHPAEPPDELGRPAVHEIGCAGEIVEHEPLEDGRSNIVLKGLWRYRIEGERTGRAYRVADVTVLPSVPLPGPAPGSPSSEELRRLLGRVVTKLALAVGRPEASELAPDLSDEGLVNEVAGRLGLDAGDRYTLLSMDRLDERYAWVLAHVESLQRRIDFLKPFRRAATGDARWN